MVTEIPKIPTRVYAQKGMTYVAIRTDTSNRVTYTHTHTSKHKIYAQSLNSHQRDAGLVSCEALHKLSVFISASDYWKRIFDECKLDDIKNISINISMNLKKQERAPPNMPLFLYCSFSSYEREGVSEKVPDKYAARS